MADDSLDFTIQGAEQMRRMLIELPRRVSDKMLFEASKEALQPMLSDAIGRAPVRTGLLRKSIRIVKKGRQPNGVFAAAIAVGKRAFYGRFLEFGTVKMAARPFMRPALDAHSQETVTRFGKAFWPAVAREFDKLKWRLSGK